MKPNSSPMIWVIAFGGLLLFVIAAWTKAQPGWLRFTLFLAAMFSELCVGSAVFVRQMDTTDRWFEFVNHGHSFCGGIAIGLLIAAIVFHFFSRRAHEQPAKATATLTPRFVERGRFSVAGKFSMKRCAGASKRSFSSFCAVGFPGWHTRGEGDD